MSTSYSSSNTFINFLKYKCLWKLDSDDKSKCEEKPPVLTVSDINVAEICLIKIPQQDFLPKVYSYFNSNSGKLCT